MTLPSDQLKRQRNRLGRDTVSAGFVKFLGRENPVPGGQYVDLFADSVNVYIKIQPVSRNLENLMGLDLTKNYSKIWSQGATGVILGATGDRFVVGRRTWQVMSVIEDWPVGSGDELGDDTNESCLLCVDITGNVQ